MSGRQAKNTRRAAAAAAAAALARPPQPVLPPPSPGTVCAALNTIATTCRDRAGAEDCPAAEAKRLLVVAWAAALFRDLLRDPGTGECVLLGKAQPHDLLAGADSIAQLHLAIANSLPPEAPAELRDGSIERARFWHTFVWALPGASLDGNQFDVLRLWLRLVANLTMLTCSGQIAPANQGPFVSQLILLTREADWILNLQEMQARIAATADGTTVMQQPAAAASDAPADAFRAAFEPCDDRCYVCGRGPQELGEQTGREPRFGYVVCREHSEMAPILVMDGPHRPRKAPAEDPPAELDADAVEAYSGQSGPGPAVDAGQVEAYARAAGDEAIDRAFLDAGEQHFAATIPPMSAADLVAAASQPIACEPAPEPTSCEPPAAEASTCSAAE